MGAGGSGHTQRMRRVGRVSAGLLRTRSPGRKAMRSTVPTPRVNLPLRGLMAQPGRAGGRSLGAWGRGLGTRA